VVDFSPVSTPRKIIPKLGYYVIIASQLYYCMLKIEISINTSVIARLTHPSPQGHSLHFPFASGSEVPMSAMADAETDSEFNQVCVVYALLLTCPQANIDVPVVENKLNNANAINFQPEKPPDDDFRGPRAPHDDQANEPVLATSGLNESNLADDSDVPDNELQALDRDEGDLNDISDGDSVDERTELSREKYANTKKRILFAPKRLKQQNQYTKILEERISMLEERFALFDRNSQKPDTLLSPPSQASLEEPSSTLKTDQKQSPTLKPDEEPSSTLKPDLNFQFWQDFDKPVVPPKYIIDVLIGEPQILRSEKISRRKTLGDAFLLNTNRAIAPSKYLPMFDAAASTEKRVLADEIAALKGNHMPERIRFNNPAILHLFSKFLRGNSHSFPGKIMLYPFKPLLQNFKEIRELMSDVSEAASKVLTECTECSPDETIEIPRVGAPKREPDDHKGVPKKVYTAGTIHADQWERILKVIGCCACSDCTKSFTVVWPTKFALDSSIRCIQDLVDNYLLPVHLKFRKQQAAKVHFHELWHLFQIGDLVVTKPLISQKNLDIASTLGMRVLMTTGGRRSYFKYGTRSKTTDIPIAIDGINQFCVHAYYLDYDGFKIVPVRRRFVIPPYTGERKVVDFEVYPMAYSSTIEQKLQDRGKSFIDLITAKSAPYINCVSLDLDTREVLNDKVIVDMKGYFNTNPTDIPVYTSPEPMDLSETGDCRKCNLMDYEWHSHSCTKVIADESSNMIAFEKYVEKTVEANLLDRDDPDAMPLDYFICHYRVFAYKLRSREWSKLFVIKYLLY
jgi:hypothetical protein